MALSTWKSLRFGTPPSASQKRRGGQGLGLRGLVGFHWTRLKPHFVPKLNVPVWSSYCLDAAFQLIIGICWYMIAKVCKQLVCVCPLAYSLLPASQYQCAVCTHAYSACSRPNDACGMPANELTVWFKKAATSVAYVHVKPR